MNIVCFLERLYQIIHVWKDLCGHILGSKYRLRYLLTWEAKRREFRCFWGICFPLITNSCTVFMLAIFYKATHDFICYKLFVDVFDSFFSQILPFLIYNSSCFQQIIEKSLLHLWYFPASLFMAWFSLSYSKLCFFKNPEIYWLWPSVYGYQHQPTYYPSLSSLVCIWCMCS